MSGPRRPHQNYTFLLAVREEKRVCAAVCALEMQFKEFVIPKSLASRQNL